LDQSWLAAYMPTAALNQRYATELLSLDDTLFINPRFAKRAVAHGNDKTEGGGGRREGERGE